MIDDAVVGLPVVCVCGATWRIWTFPKFVMAPLCGCWVSLLLAKGDTQGFSIFLCRAYICRNITVVNGRLKFEMTILYFI